jgi:hypothetical protein
MSGVLPSEYSSGARTRLGHLTKQRNPFLRFLWREAVMGSVRRDPELQRFFRRNLAQKGLGKARVAAARKLGIRLRIMLRGSDHVRRNSVAVDGTREGGHDAQRVHTGDRWFVARGRRQSRIRIVHYCSQSGNGCGANSLKRWLAALDDFRNWLQLGLPARERA